MPVPGGTTRKLSERLLAPAAGSGSARRCAHIRARRLLAKARRRAELVDDHGVVDDEVDRHQRVDLLGIAAERGHRVAHRGEVDHGRHAGEVLHQHARRPEGDLDARLALVGQPAGHRLDVVLGDGAAVLVAQQVFEQHLHREGQLGDAGQAVLFGLDRLK